MDTWSGGLNSCFALKDCLLGGIKLAKNSDLDKYVYIGYETGFDLRSVFSVFDSSVGKNVIIFGADISSSACIDNKKKRYLNSW